MSDVDNFELQTFIKEPDQTGSVEWKINVSRSRLVLLPHG